MAYQPKSYRKFVATAATATLVAGAIAPIASAASFTDVSAKYKEAVDFVVSKGANGLTSTTFGVGSDIKRVDAAVLLVNVLGLDIEKAPASGFTDVPARAAKHVNALKAAGITNGKSATKFDAESKITRGELALWIQKGFELKGEGNVTFTDVSDRYKEAVSALVANEITNGTSATQFGTDKTAKRGDYAIFLQKAAAPVSPVSIASVSAINTKTLKVEFNKAVDTTKAKFEVKKGSVVVNVAKTTPSADNKSFELELASKFFEGEYTVNVTGLTEKALSGSVKVENEKVAKIEVLSDVAPLSEDGNTATVGYVVKNQYDEDITNSSLATSINWNATSGLADDNNKGVVSVDVTGKKAGDKVVVTGINQTTNTVVSTTLTLSNKAVADVVTFKNIYNADNKELNSKSTFSEFPLLVDVKDQYGTSLKAAVINKDVLFTSSNEGILKIKQANDDKGKDKNEVGLELVAGDYVANGGKVIITAITKSTGKVTQFEVNVKAAATLDTFAITSPTDLVAANDTVKIPFTAADQYGTALTKFKEVTGQVDFSATGNEQPVLKEDANGDAYVEYKPSTKGTKVIFATTKTGKVSQITINVQEPAEGVTIEPLKDVTSLVAVNGKSEITAKNLEVKDQYGRTFKLADHFADYKVVATETDNNNTISLTGTEIAKANDKIVISGSTKGSEEVTFTLHKKDKDGNFQEVKTSPLKVTFSVTDKTAFASYEVGNVDTVYADAKTDAYTRDLNVYGVTAKGEKVLIPETNYTVTSSNGALSYINGKLDVIDGVDVATVFGTNNEIKVNVTIIVDAAEKPVTLTKEVTLSKVAPKTAKVEFDALKLVNGLGNVTVAELASTTDAAALKSALKLVDQYGVAYTPSEVLITVTNVVDADKSGAITVNNNGKANVDLVGATAGDTFVTTYLIDGQVGTLNFKVVSTPQ